MFYELFDNLSTLENLEAIFLSAYELNGEQLRNDEQISQQNYHSENKQTDVVILNQLSADHQETTAVGRSGRVGQEEAQEMEMIQERSTGMTALSRSTRREPQEHSIGKVDLERSAEGGPQETGLAFCDLSLVCPICAAEFMPAPFAQLTLTHGSQQVEAAFKQLCHACPSCHRSACPNCWDSFYQTCFACIQEAGLPVGVWTDSSEQSTLSTMFICMLLGKFQLEHLGIAPAILLKTPATPAPATDWKQKSVLLAEVELFSSIPGIVDLLRRMEQILTVFVSLLLCAIVIMCGLALVIEQVNNLFAVWLHIDFRREVAYYSHLLQHM